MSRTLILLVAVAFPAAGRADPADDLDAELLRVAPKLVEHCKAHKLTNVGVVKFLVRVGDAKPSDDVGELNLALADRLEVALLLANPDADGLGVIRRASAAVIAAKNTFANHRDADGRKAFFADQTYRLAWGPEVKADAFFTGELALDKDLAKAALTFQAFDAAGTLETLRDAVAVEPSPRLLAEAGFSYLVDPKKLADAPDAPKRKRRNLQVVAEVRQEAADFAKADKGTLHPALRNAPLKWTILYDSKPVPFEGDRVPEPVRGQVVTFVLENRADFVVGAVLKVNGENVLFRERLPVERCRKFVLEPGQKVEVEGFRSDEKTVKPFEVLSAEASRDDEVRYGEHVGTFRLTAFRGKLVEADPTADENKSLADADRMLVAIARGGRDAVKIPAGNAKSVKEYLLGREAAQAGAHGLVVEGTAATTKAARYVFFRPEPDLAINDVTVRYYTPAKK